jgi:Zn-dependent hydrolases, including glyoxylases
MLRNICGVYTVCGKEITNPLDSNCYLVEKDGYSYMVDAGSGLSTNEILSNVFQIIKSIKKLKAIINTHCHYSNSGGDYFFSNLGLPIIAHEPDSFDISSRERVECADIDYKPYPSRVTLSLRNKVDKLSELGVITINFPYITEGSIIVIDNERKVAFIDHSETLERNYQELIGIFKDYSVQCICDSLKCFRVKY